MSKIINKYKKKLKSNIIIEKNISNIIIKQLNFTGVYIEQLVINKKLEILILRYKDTIIKEIYNLYANLS